MIRELITKSRSYRRFDQKHSVPMDVLMELADCARLSPSARNAQPLKYALCNDESKNAGIFSALGWAGYLQGKGTPPEGERPSAYIAILGDRSVSENFFCDHGIAAQSILLAAAEKGLGGCIIATIKKEELRTVLGLADTLEILLVIALGKPVETVVLEPLGPGGDIKYWRDEKQVHHVPKRGLDSVIAARFGR